MGRRRQRGKSPDLIPEDRQAWAASIWQDRQEVARTEVGAWMLRQAAAILGKPEEDVDALLTVYRGGPPDAP